MQITMVSVQVPLSILVLMMDLNGNYPNNDDVPLVDNIEDLQVQYCVDDSTDTVNCNLSNKWLDEFTASTQSPMSGEPVFH